MARPPDDPTRRIPPTGRERVVEHEPPPGPDPLMERLDSMRTALAVLGLIAVAALGIAVWALLRAADAERDGGGGRAAEVQSLRDEVSELESRIENRATEGDVSDLAEQQQGLADRIDEVAEQAGSQEPAEATDPEAREALEAVDQTLQEIDQRLTALEEQAQQSP